MAKMFIKALEILIKVKYTEQKCRKRQFCSAQKKEIL